MDEYTIPACKIVTFRHPGLTDLQEKESHLFPFLTSEVVL